MNAAKLRASYDRAVSRLDWEAMADVFAARGWVYGGLTKAAPPSAEQLRECADELFASCLVQLEVGERDDAWFMSGRLKVSVDAGVVSIEGQALVYRDAVGPTDLLPNNTEG